MSTAFGVTRGIALLALAFLLFAPRHARAERESPQSLIEAGFVLKIPLFIVWPKGHPFTPSFPISIAILGDKEMLKQAAVVLSSSIPGGRKTSAEEIANPETISSYHEVFIGDRFCSDLDTLLPAIKDIPVITVSRCKNFIEAGGMFRLYRDGLHVRIEMNKEAVEAAGLSIDYRLSAMAKQAR